MSRMFESVFKEANSDELYNSYEKEANSDELYNSYEKEAKRTEKQRLRLSKNIYKDFYSYQGEFENTFANVSKDGDKFILDKVFVKCEEGSIGGVVNLKIPESGEFTKEELFKELMSANSNDAGRLIQAFSKIHEWDFEPSLDTMLNCLNSAIKNAIDQFDLKNSDKRKNARTAGEHRLSKLQKMYKGYLDAYNSEDYKEGPVKPYHTGFETHAADDWFSNKTYGKKTISPEDSDVKDYLKNLYNED